MYGRFFRNLTQHKHNSSDMQEYVGKPSETDSIKSKISSKTSRGKKDSTKRHHHRSVGRKSLFRRCRFLRQGYRYHKLRKAFSKFYRRHFDIVSKYNVGLKTLLLQGLSEPEFYGDLVYKFRKIIGKIDFPYHFKKIIVRYKKIGYNINVMRQTACLVVNPIKVNSFAYLFNCTTVGRTSD